jgi:hypothetical protein
MGHRVLFIGDIHGNSDWEQIAYDGLKSFCEIVFLGDYCDSFTIKPVEQIHNLKKLIEFIQKHRDSVTALLGNHDYAYIHGYSGISGHQHAHSHEYRDLFQKNIDLFNIAWGYTNDRTKKYTLATHAGLTYGFWNKFIKSEYQEGRFLNRITEGKSIEDFQLHETLNFLKDKGDILWKVGTARGGSGTPGPLWADYSELLEDPYPNIHQIMGHTPKASPTIEMDGENLYACIDSWGNKRTANLIVSL